MNSADIHPIDITVVVLNYRNAEDSTACLDAIYTMPDAPRRVILVDNHSRDGSPERLLDAWERLAGPVLRMNAKDDTPDADAMLIRLPENKGYSAGNNAGVLLALRDSACRAVWILNNDTEPAPDSLQKLCDRLNACPNAGMSGSTLVYAHDRETVQCAGGYGFSKYTGATPAQCGNECLSSVLAIDPEIVERKLDYLCGASMLARREVFEAVGYFSEEFFLYYEDAEFGLRARQAGFRLVWAPDSVVFHKEGGSTGAKSASAARSAERSELMDYLALRNRIYLVRKFFPIFTPLAVLSYAGVLMNRVRRGQAGRVFLVLRALMDGLRGRMGKPHKKGNI